MQTNPEANKQILEVLRLVDTPTAFIAVARIEELERQLAECVAAIRRWSETLPDTKEDFLAALYALDIAERSIESAAPETAERIEKLAQQLEVECQERQDVEWECNALRERVTKHISDQLDYWKQEAQK